VNQALYTVAFLKEGKVVDRFLFTADSLDAFKKELVRIRSEFRRRRPGLKEVMSVTSIPSKGYEARRASSSN
jgi:hypothetical protein